MTSSSLTNPPVVTYQGPLGDFLRIGVDISVG